jgi:glutamate synthase (NADPH/NADH) large chain/glutamate synthase (ferredoxin)
MIRVRPSLESSPVSRSGHERGDLVRRQVLFGYTREEISLVIEPMVRNSAEAVGSMGDDTALAVLNERPRLLYHYFKQKFAQVTNPPIDSIREKLVTSLDVYLGHRRSLLEETPEHARLVHLTGPILTAADVDGLRKLTAVDLDATFPADEGANGLAPALERLAAEAEAAMEAGAQILILSDRNAGEERAPAPMLAAVGAVHHGLIRRGKRMRASLVAETGEARDVHQLACLVGYGASAVCPYLALETLADLHRKGGFEELSLDEVLRRYVNAAETGVLKIMSKMGISTLSAYQGAQIFEAVGLGSEVTGCCFAGTPSRLGGIGFREIGDDLLDRHRAAHAEPAPSLDEGGFFRFRRDGEPHAFSPAVAKALFKASGTGSREDYAEYLALSRSQPPTTLRDLLRFRKTRPPVHVEEVEPIEAILRRFTSGAMSLGALSPEAHETLAIGMNRLGGKSNTGEGGEDPLRFRPTDPDRNANSAIKQVASGRFGVTPEYLVHAEELEIKMAQGSKPGEGGQLPGHKVSSYIAELRHTLPGTPLVSPPPHHDIYSIEDLAQLIYDLKQTNPWARVSVKLVAEEGVGTIAAGVAKGYADVIHISGHEGGTGASPLSSVKHAGLPWELGLAETQQVLVLNNLRDRVRLRTDGGLKSGRDVLVAALLGAEEYAFGTAALIAMGCRMARQCHLNTCPVGIATQRDDLRAKFPGTPDNVWNLFVHVAFETRELLAEMGFRSLDEVIGRMDLLEPDGLSIEGPTGRAASLDLGALVWMPEDDRPLHSSLGRNLPPAESFDDRVLPEVQAALDSGVFLALARRVRNVDRSIGARISGEVSFRYGAAGLPPGTLELELEGSAGQSLGAFLAPGVRILLTGEANDYVGKGMAGGEIVIRPTATSPSGSRDDVLVGNTVLYGATGGSLFVAGRAGERFAVRNSGARAVVEGVGDHCCEYMTQGVVAVLGDAGRNFGSGMSNGVAYVLDEFGEFARRVQDSAVGLERLAGDADEELLLALLQRHLRLTGSARGQAVLSRWTHFRPRFWKVAPKAALAEETHASLVRDHLTELRLTSLETAAETGVGG